MCSDYKYHFVYETTNDLNGDYYIGVHQTDDLNDGYMGSGLRLRRAMNLYGKSNFTRTIIKFFDNRDDALRYEEEALDDKKLNDIHCYNIARGGYGGNTIAGFTQEERENFCDKLRNQKRSEETRQKMSKSAKNRYADENERKKLMERGFKKGNIPWNSGKSGTYHLPPHSDETKDKIRKAVSGPKNGHYGKKAWNSDKTEIYSQETIQKMKDSHTGKRWISNDTLREIRCIDGTELQSYIDDGWITGRKNYKYIKTKL